MEENKIEIRQISDKEIWVGQNKLKLGEDGILYESLVGDLDAGLSLALKTAAFKLIATAQGVINTLVDLSLTGKPSYEARRIHNKKYNSAAFGKVAYYGAHPVARVIASFFMAIIDKKNMRYFKIKEDALAWLKE